MGKLAIYLPSLEGGGAERITVILANALAQMGHEVDLVLANARGPYLSEVSRGVRTIDLRSRRVAFSLPALAAYLRRERPNALLSGLGHANIAAIVALRLARQPTRLAITEHNSIARGLDTAKGRILKWLMRKLYSRADAVICVSKGIEDELADLLGLPAGKLHTIYNPVDVDRIRERASIRPDHAWLAPGQPPVIVSVGRLTEQKDFATLLRAFAELRQRRAARLVILGEGKERSSLERLANALGISSDVAILGFQENPYGWLAAGTVFAMSSAWEGLPGALLEAMACGTPVVSTNCRTGPDEILEGGKWGRLVPVGDAPALARAIEMSLEAPVIPDVGARIIDFRPEHSTASYEKVLFG